MGQELKQKQIEEMAKTMCFQRDSCPVKSCVGVNCEQTWVAEALYNAGYRKIPEGAVVLTAEQFSDYLTLKDSHKNAVERCEKLQADNERLYKNIGNFKEVVRKETAEKFAERLKSEMQERDYMGVKYKQGVFTDSDINEICKEIAKGNK